MNTRFPPARLARALATCALAATTAGAHAAFIR